MTLDFEVTEIDTTIEIVSITESESGDTITFIYGEVYNESIITGRKIRHYSISSFDLPVHIGYELDLDKFSIGAEFGLSLNVTKIARGELLSSQTEFLNLEEDNVFKDKIGIGYDSKLFAAYKLDARNKIYASLSLNISPESIVLPEGNLDQNYKSIGISLGYGFLF